MSRSAVPPGCAIYKNRTGKLKKIYTMRTEKYFAAAVVRLPLVATGFFQYIAPSMSLMIAGFCYGEPFGISELISFGFIRVALAIFSIETWIHQRKLRQISLSSRASRIS